jgi:SAM-dependent methyltransferase
MIAPTPKNLSAPFIELCSHLIDPIVFELGTKRSIPDRCTMHKEWIPQAKAWVGIDFEPGADVDVVANAENLFRDLVSAGAEHRWADVVISCSTFEHIQRPWLAAEQIGKVLQPGGLFFVQTHQTFPLHAYPWDYWRYTIDSLRLLFQEFGGLTIIDAAYEFPATIVSAQDPRSANGPAFLNVCLIARKPS